MGFKSFLGGWAGSTIAACIHGLLASLLLLGTMPQVWGQGGLMHNSFVAGLLITGLIFLVHKPFGLQLRWLNAIIWGWVFTVGFMVIQGTLIAAALNTVVLITALIFGAVLGTGCYLGVWLCSPKPTAT